MWETQVDVLDDGRVHHVALLRDGAGVSYADVVQYWRTDEPFRAIACMPAGGQATMVPEGITIAPPWAQ